MTDTVCNVEKFAKTGNCLPSYCSSYRIRIDEECYEVSDPVITGRQLLDEAAKRPVDEHLIFQYLHNGQLEEIRLDETVDLRQPGLEKFLTFKSDRSFRFVIDGRRFEWGAPFITGYKLKQLAQVDPKTYGIWLEVRGDEDRLVADNELIDLSAEGVERFFTGVMTTTEG
jgi:ferredoxin